MLAVYRREDKKVIGFPVIEGTGKRRKDGELKQTPNNCAKGRSTWVEPITEIEDVYRIIDYLQSRIDAEPKMGYKRNRARNKLYFCIGVFSGFRVSDMLTLKWSDIFERDGKTYKEQVGIVEEKTGKIKELYTTEASRQYIDEYVREWHPDTTSDDFIFQNYRGEAINRQTVDNFIKEATRAIGLKGNYSTHSVRKTYAYQYYIVMSNEGDAFALAEVQDMLNHLNTQTTLRYLGIDRKRRSENMRKFAEAMMRRDG